MKTNTRQRIPLLITALAVLLVSFLYMIGEETKNRTEGKFKLDIFDKLESITYDARVRMALDFLKTDPSSAKLATLFIDDTAIDLINSGAYAPFLAPAWDDGNSENLNFKYPWPRFIYGQLIRELHAQKAKAIGFDVFFAELDRLTPDTDVTFVEAGETNLATSDEFFAHQIASSSNIVLATEGDLMPKDLFAHGALAIGNIAATNDYGVLRRVQAFGQYKVWDERITSQQKALRLQIDKYKIETNVLKIPMIPTLQDLEIKATNYWEIPLHENGALKLTKDGSLNLGDDPNDMGPTNEPPYSFKRAWNLGIALAAHELGLDLEHAEVRDDRITLRGPNGLTRVIPTERDHSFYIDWSLRWIDIIKGKTPVLVGSPTELLVQDLGRQKGTNKWEDAFAGRLIIVGSVATGNNVADRGDTPIEPGTPLVTKHLNVASSILSGRFIQRSTTVMTLCLILSLGIISAMITWRTKEVTVASVAIAVIAMIYVFGAFFLYIQNRYWLPIVMPVFGGLLLPHFALVTYRVVFEQREQRHIKSTFQRLVAPEIVDEILATENLDLGGERRDITVYFADVRGFTEFTDRAHGEALAYIEKKKLTPEDAEVFLNKQAQETMNTVNLYLGTISRQIKKHHGTLDKYIGDCVMAFWGAPIGEDQHALLAVRAAIDSQRAMFAVNQDRYKENEARKKENIDREARGEDPLSMLPLLTLGSGINSGPCVVGMMGSAEHVSSYTVFGREVNLASRLEGVSGRGRIIVSYRTYVDCKKFDRELASTFVELEAVKVKGIAEAVRIFEVPWKIADDTGGTVLMTASAVPVKAQQPTHDTTIQTKPAASSKSASQS